jgi:hypothetical protein
MRHMYKLVAVSSRPIFRLSTWFPPRVSSKIKDEIQKTRRKFPRPRGSRGRQRTGGWALAGRVLGVTVPFFLIVFCVNEVSVKKMLGLFNVNDLTVNI